MRSKTLLVLGLLSFIWPVQGQVPERQSRWEQDLAFFASQFPSHQRDFEKLYSRPAFDAELVRLKSDLSKSSDVEIVLRLMRLVAGAKVGHTTVYLPVLKLGFRPIPLSTAWYSDGLAVIGATPEYTEHLGTRVLKIGSMSPEQLLSAVAPYISHENDRWLRQQSPGFMQMRPILQNVGAFGSDEPLKLTLAKPGGEPYALEIPANARLSMQSSMYDILPIPPPLNRKHRDRNYWYEYLADSQTLYIQYNKCKDDPALPFSKFTAELFGKADSVTVKHVAIDLRFNGGGDSRVIRPLMDGLRSRKTLRSRTYVLIGPGTFSSAQLNAVELREKLGAVLGGESTGENLNSYGEVRSFTLPNSQVQVQYSTKFFQMSKADRPELEPNVVKKASLADALAGRDPVLEYVLTR